MSMKVDHTTAFVLRTSNAVNKAFVLFHVTGYNVTGPNAPPTMLGNNQPFAAAKRARRREARCDCLFLCVSPRESHCQSTWYILGFGVSAGNLPRTIIYAANASLD
jgi:hypothetical protein